MATIQEKGGEGAEIYRVRAEIAIDIAKNVAEQVKDAIGTVAVPAIAEHQEVLDRYVNPIVLSPQMKALGGTWNGVGCLATHMTLGFLSLVGGVVARQVSLKRIASDSWEMLKQGALHAGDYVRRTAEVTDPYEMASASVEKIGGAVAVLAGAKSLGQGAFSGAVAVGKAFSHPPSAALAGVGGGVATGASSVFVDGSAVATAASGMGGGLTLMQGVGGRIGDELSPFDKAWIGRVLDDWVRNSNKQVHGSPVYNRRLKQLSRLKNEKLLAYAERQRASLAKKADIRFTKKADIRLEETVVDYNRRVPLEESIALQDALRAIGKGKVADSLVPLDAYLRGKFDTIIEVAKVGDDVAEAQRVFVYIMSEAKHWRTAGPAS